MKLAFLWHQHQPYYKDLRTGDYLLPWVRLHGVKDYLDMVEILKSFPRVKQTFNMVPSLLEQIEDYAEGRASDNHLKLTLKKASELTEKDKSTAIDIFFQANYDNLITPLPRYRRLYESRKTYNKWKESDWLDLQCLFNLAWIDPSFRKSGRLLELSKKGERYTEEDKREILSSQREIISSIIPTLREMADTGQIEISTTPYFHPIMPLLYDTDTARTAIPDIKLPAQRFNHPEDLEKQLAMAVELYSNLFGSAPKGIWPSEGAVSEDIIPIIRKLGIKWLASDEEILAQSLSVPDRDGNVGGLISSGELYKPYKFDSGGGEVSMFFRDHALSDNIGFVYSKWAPDKAADDFLEKLRAIDANLQKRKIKNPIVSVILDGENAWEFYKNDGHDFLRALYTKISETDWIETTTFSGYLEGNPERRKLDKIFPGSWINHNFAIWIGHPEDNKAWDLLSRARGELVEFEKNNPSFDGDKLNLAWREIYIAEGSDWCWWFGDDHIAANNDDFDRLFRSHLANVYYLTDREPPPEFFSPIRADYSMEFLNVPIDYITPRIDGILTHFYEWHQAGFYDCLKAGSAMHKAEPIIAGIWFGYDPKNLYFRIDASSKEILDRFMNFSFELEFLIPEKKKVTIRPGTETAVSGLTTALKDILEVGLPLDFFEDLREGKFLFKLNIKEDGNLLENWPVSEALSMEIPRPGSKQIPWVL